MKDGQQSTVHKLRMQIIEELNLMKKASADEIAMAIMERNGISSEEAVAELIVEVKHELVEMTEQQYVFKVKPHGEKSRYVLATGTIS